MDGMKKVRRSKSLLTKYLYPAIVVCIGILLLLLPGKKDEEEVVSTEPVTIQTMESQLEEILSTIDGAGEVRVLLGVAEGEEVIYQTDVESNQSEDDHSKFTKTIIISDSQRGETGLVQKTNPTKYFGAVISCQGADDPVVRLAITDAVSTVLGLGADKISVVKMK